MSDMKSALNGTTNEIRVLSEAEALDLPSIISRWSSTGVAPPHSIVTPTTAEDIIAVIQFARLNKLKIIPAGGGHSPFTPITNDTIYLSMTKFKNIKLDETSGDVTFGGGVLTGEVLKHLGHRGWVCQETTDACRSKADLFAVYLRTKLELCRLGRCFTWRYAPSYYWLAWTGHAEYQGSDHYSFLVAQRIYADRDHDQPEIWQ